MIYMSRSRATRVMLLLAVALIAFFVLHLGVQREAPNFADSLRSLLHAFGLGAANADALHDFVVAQIRLPRALMAVFGGASLGLAGAVMQAAFRNPLAAPDIVGTSAGAALGGAVAIVAGAASQSLLAVPICSLAGALLATWLVFLLAGTGNRFSTTGILLAGVAFNLLLGALTTFVVTTQFGNYAASSDVLFWLMGGLSRSAWPQVAITVVGFLLFSAALLPRLQQLDVLTLGDDSAHSLGVEVVRARTMLLWVAAGLTAATVANTGGIAFVGLIVPHLARLIVGPVHRSLLPTAALLGALVLLLSDLLCRNVPAHWNLPLGVVTSVLGAPYFIVLLRRHRRGEELQ